MTRATCARLAATETPVVIPSTRSCKVPISYDAGAYRDKIQIKSAAASAN